MFMKKDDERDGDPGVIERDEHAYEDAWYRALKVKANRRESDTHDEETQGPASREA